MLKNDKVNVRYGPSFDYPIKYVYKKRFLPVKIIDKTLIKVLTHERGVGITDACGSGACASFAVGNLLNYVQKKVCVEMKGGNLNIELSKDKHIIMIGKAKKVFEGIFMLS